MNIKDRIERGKCVRKTSAVQKKEEESSFFSVMEETCLDIGDVYPLSVVWMDGWLGERQADG